MIRVQREDFDVGAELQRLAAGNPRIGGVASFIGLVRDLGGDDRVSALTLEHYPGMTEKKLSEIETEAHRRWPMLCWSSTATAGSSPATASCWSPQPRRTAKPHSPPASS